jgi:hypothetical protein
LLTGSSVVRSHGAKMASGDQLVAISTSRGALEAGSCKRRPFTVTVAYSGAPRRSHQLDPGARTRWLPSATVPAHEIEDPLEDETSVQHEPPAAAMVKANGPVPGAIRNRTEPAAIEVGEIGPVADVVAVDFPKERDAEPDPDRP